MCYIIVVAIAYGRLAQLVEYLPYKQRVTGSSPVSPTTRLHFTREWLSGRALPCQGKCREFESRLPLQNTTCCSIKMACLLYIV